MKNPNSVQKKQSSNPVNDATARYLVQAVVLEETPAIYRLTRVNYIVSLLVLGLILWCQFADVPELASAQGEIVPYGRVHKVQHLEGGAVADIHVRNGDQVSRDEPLITLDDESLTTELNSVVSSKVDLELRLERLEALRDSRAPAFSLNAQQYPLLLSTQMSLYKEQIINDQERRAAIKNKISNRKAELKSKQKQQLALREEASIYSQQRDMRLSLFKNNQVAKVDMLDTSARLASAQNRVAEVDGELERLENTVTELQQEMQQYHAQRRETLNTDRSDAARQLAIVNQQISNLETRIDRTVIRAQIDGIVKGLLINSINAVVGSGEILMELVPMGEELLVEARLLPEDVGHVLLGQSAEVKVSSFDYQRFGSIRGTLKNVSATTYLDADSAPYYLAEIRLSQNYVGTKSDTNMIVPGMTVQADIVTGSKSVLSYLLKPLRRGLEGAFSER